MRAWYVCVVRRSSAHQEAPALCALMTERR